MGLVWFPAFLVSPLSACQLHERNSVYLDDNGLSAQVVTDILGFVDDLCAIQKIVT